MSTPPTIPINTENAAVVANNNNRNNIKKFEEKLPECYNPLIVAAEKNRFRVWKIKFAVAQVYTLDCSFGKLYSPNQMKIAVSRDGKGWELNEFLTIVFQGMWTEAYGKDYDSEEETERVDELFVEIIESIQKFSGKTTESMRNMSELVQEAKKNHPENFPEPPKKKQKISSMDKSEKERSLKEIWKRVIYIQDDNWEFVRPLEIKEALLSTVALLFESNENPEQDYKIPRQCIEEFYNDKNIEYIKNVITTIASIDGYSKLTKDVQDLVDKAQRKIPLFNKETENRWPIQPNIDKFLSPMFAGSFIYKMGVGLYEFYFKSDELFEQFTTDAIAWLNKS